MGVVQPALARHGVSRVGMAERGLMRWPRARLCAYAATAQRGICESGCARLRAIGATQLVAPARRRLEG
jgi:hypothetical protein